MSEIIKIKGNIAAIISWSVVLLWMMLIFFLSAQSALESNQLSLGITGMILRLIERLTVKVGTNANWINEFNNIVRKSAHALVFFVLAMMVLNAFLKTGVKGFKAFVYSLIFTTLYACTDEIHQLFVPGRACMLSDVFIDSIGGCLGLIVFIIGYKLHRLIRRIKWFGVG
jgi:VanZ family protein